MLKRENIWNVPNFLTMLRLALVGVFIWLFVEERRAAAAAVFVVAGVTDMLDGYIARRYNLITSFGKLMDPLADKLMLIAALSCLLAIGRVPVWLLLIVLAKEGTMVAGSYLMLRRGIVAQAQGIGKTAQLTFSAAVVASFLHDALAPVDLILQCAAVVLTLAALAFYVRGGIQKVREQNK